MSKFLDESDIPRIWSTVVDDDGVGVRRQVLLYKHLYAEHGPDTIIRTSKRYGLFTYLLGTNEDETVANRKQAKVRYDDARVYRAVRTIRLREDDDITGQLLRSARSEGDHAVATGVSVESEPEALVQVVPVEVAVDDAAQDIPVEATVDIAVQVVPDEVAVDDAFERYNDEREYQIRLRDYPDITAQSLRTSRKEERKVLASLWPVDSESDTSDQGTPVEVAVQDIPVEVAADDTPVEAVVDDTPVEDHLAESDSDSDFDDGASLFSQDFIETAHRVRTVCGFMYGVYNLTTLLYRNM
jgi:hypothetical protein